MASYDDSSFNPYGFLMTGGRRGSMSQGASLSDHDGSAGQRTPPQPSEASMTSPHCPTEHGRYLSDQCEFIVPPQLTPLDRETPSHARTLFLGHLKFETTASEVRWMIKKLVDVTALKVDIRGTGCFVVYLANESDELAVRTLNRRVLLDHNGFWFARTPASVDTLIDYVEKVLPRLGGSRRRSLRLPRDCLVVEDPRSKRTFRRTPVQLTPNKDRFLPSGPPSPYSLGSPSLGLGGFHSSPPDYVLGGEDMMMCPPPYGY